MKKNIFIFFVFFFFISIYFRELSKNKYLFLNNQNICDEQITLLLSDVDNEFRLDENLFSKLDGLADYVFLDREIDLKIFNSVKINDYSSVNSSIGLVQEPDFIYLLDELHDRLEIISNVRNDLTIETISHLRKIEYVLFNLSLLYNDKNHNYDYSTLFKTLISTNFHDFYDIDNYKITIIPENKFSTYKSKEIYYKELFLFLDTLDQVDQIIFSNEMIQKIYLKYSKYGNKSYLEKNIYGYVGNIDELRIKTDSLQFIYSNQKIFSAVDFISKKSFRDENYKLLRKFKTNYINYSKKGTISYNENTEIIIEKFEQILDQLNEINIYALISDSKYRKSLENTIIHTNKIISSSKVKELGFAHNHLYRYNNEIITFINSLNLLETTDENYLDNQIRLKYFDSNKNKWIIKISDSGILNNNKLNQILDYDTSIIKNDYKIEIFVFFFLIMSIIIYRKYII